VLGSFCALRSVATRGGARACQGLDGLRLGDRHAVLVVLCQVAESCARTGQDLRGPAQRPVGIGGREEGGWRETWRDGERLRKLKSARARARERETERERERERASERARDRKKGEKRERERTRLVV